MPRPVVQQPPAAVVAARSLERDFLATCDRMTRWTRNGSPMHRELSDIGSLRADTLDIRLDECLGSGAFGDVYKGTWKGVPVAIKLIKPRRDGEYKRLLEEMAREVAIPRAAAGEWTALYGRREPGAKPPFPSVLAWGVWAYGTAGWRVKPPRDLPAAAVRGAPRPFILSELMDRTMSKVSSARGTARPFSEWEVRAVAKRLLQAMDALDIAGVHHCDLKLDNSMLRRSAEGSRSSRRPIPSDMRPADLCVIDFGGSVVGSNQNSMAHSYYTPECWSARTEGKRRYGDRCDCTSSWDAGMVAIYLLKLLDPSQGDSAGRGKMCPGGPHRPPRAPPVSCGAGHFDFMELPEMRKPWPRVVGAGDGADELHVDPAECYQCKRAHTRALQDFMVAAIEEEAYKVRSPRALLGSAWLTSSLRRLVPGKYVLAGRLPSKLRAGVARAAGGKAPAQFVVPASWRPETDYAILDTGEFVLSKLTADQGGINEVVPGGAVGSISVSDPQSLWLFVLNPDWDRVWGTESRSVAVRYVRADGGRAWLEPEWVGRGEE